MKINTINLKNFRCYEELYIKLNPKYNILLGSNGAGKTAILDAIAISLGAYISVLDQSNTRSITKEDTRKVHFDIASDTQIESIYPVEILAESDTAKEGIQWKISKKSINHSITKTDVNEIISYAQKQQHEIRKGNKDILLPVIVYYGTDRLWHQKKMKREIDEKSNSRFDGYIDCLSFASNAKLMFRWFEKMTYISLQENKRVPELDVVTKAIEQTYLMIDQTVKKISVSYKVKTEQLEIEMIKKTGEIDTLSLKQMSDGTQTILNLVADIAYRMAVLNPQLLDEITTKTTGIVMIDEIDMHLHPSWQARIIDALHQTFPQVQFICTTHAPTIIANIENQYIQEVTKTSVLVVNEKTFGHSVDSIMEDIMGAHSRNVSVEEQFEQFYQRIDEGKLEDARIILSRLEQKLGMTETEVVKAQTTIFLEEGQEDSE